MQFAADDFKKATTLETFACPPWVLTGEDLPGSNRRMKRSALLRLIASPIGTFFWLPGADSPTTDLVMSSTPPGIPADLDSS